jgi:hypothetical protein
VDRRGSPSWTFRMTRGCQPPCDLLWCSGKEARQWGLSLTSVESLWATIWMVLKVSEEGSRCLVFQPMADMLSLLSRDRMYLASSLRTRHSSQMLMAIPMNSNRLLNPLAHETEEWDSGPPPSSFDAVPKTTEGTCVQKGEAGG